MRFTPSTILLAAAGIFFSAVVNAASVPSNPQYFTLRAWNTPLNPLQPLINHPVELDNEGNLIVNLASSNNQVLNFVCHAGILSIKAVRYPQFHSTN